MKKYLVFILAILIVCSVAACGSNETETTQPTEETQAFVNNPETRRPNIAETPALYFEVDGIKMVIGAPADDVLAALGTPAGTYESKSCALNAKDTNYRYNGFVLTVTSPEQGDSYIAGIELKADTHSVPGGIRIKSTLEDMLAAYGTDYQEEKGFYKYKDGVTALEFAVIDGLVEQIIYSYIYD